MGQLTYRSRLPSPTSRHPHARRPESGPRPQCIAINRVNGLRCRRLITQGRTKLCRLHLAKAKAAPDPETYLAELSQPPKTGPARPDEYRGQRAGDPDGLKGAPNPRPQDVVKRGISTSVIRQHKSATALVISAQSRRALEKLGQPFDPTDPKSRRDPKEILLELVASAHQQVLVWAAMLSAIPEADFDQIGVTPIPGNPATSKGTRIEALQKFLTDSTKTAARISKMAIDAGIEERLVRLAEEQQALIADTVRAGLLAALAQLVRELRLSPEAEAQALSAGLGAAANHLRMLAAGTPPEVIEGVATVVERHRKSAPKAARYKAKQDAKADARASRTGGLVNQEILDAEGEPI